MGKKVALALLGAGRIDRSSCVRRHAEHWSPTRRRGVRRRRRDSRAPTRTRAATRRASTRRSSSPARAPNTASSTSSQLRRRHQTQNARGQRSSASAVSGGDAGNGRTATPQHDAFLRLTLQVQNRDKVPHRFAFGQTMLGDRRRQLSRAHRRGEERRPRSDRQGERRPRRAGRDAARRRACSTSPKPTTSRSREWAASSYGTSARERGEISEAWPDRADSPVRRRTHELSGLDAAGTLGRGTAPRSGGPRCPDSSGWTAAATRRSPSGRRRIPRRSRRPSLPSARSSSSGSIAMVTRGPGHAEHVRELPLDEPLVIMRRPIAGG